MAQIPIDRLGKGPYKPICRDCAIYFSIAVLGWFPIGISSCRGLFSGDTLVSGGVQP